MINFDDVTNENVKEHNPHWPQNPDQPQRILIIGGSGSVKINLLFNLISHQPDTDAKDPYQAKYQLLISKCGNTSLKYINDSKVFVQY